MGAVASRSCPWAAVVLATSVCAWGVQQARSPEWTSLFNGKDLGGLEIDLSHPMPGQVQHDRKPEPIFTVVTEDSEPAIHISGRVWGPLVSEREYGDFHLRMEFKWGEAIWPPLPVRDSGVMSRGVGRRGSVIQDGRSVEPPQKGFWMPSVEYQFTHSAGREGDVGGAYVLGDDRIRMDMVARHHPLQRPHGEWNLIDIRCVGIAAHLLLNGGRSARREHPPHRSGRSDHPGPSPDPLGGRRGLLSPHRDPADHRPQGLARPIDEDRREGARAPAWQGAAAFSA